MAVADASFNMSIDSILLGSIVASGLVELFPWPTEVETPAPVIGKPVSYTHLTLPTSYAV